MSCGKDAKKCTSTAQGQGAPEITATWAEGRDGGGHCPDCGGFLTTEGVCNNPGCFSADAIAAHIKALPVIKYGYRVDSGFTYRGQATDVIDFERTLGNNNKVSPETYEALRRNSVMAQDLVWVGKDVREIAEHYGDEDDANVETVNMPQGSVIIGEDGDDGYLVWKGAAEKTFAMARASSSILRVLGSVSSSDMGFCPDCGATLSVVPGEEDWCMECEELVNANTPPDPFSDFMNEQRKFQVPISSGVEGRWHSRVEANGWQHSEEGAEAYLKRYGRNIGAVKVKQFVEIAESYGYDDFARGMWKKLYELMK